MAAKLCKICLWIAIGMLVSACSKDEIQGENSLEGSWTINQIETVYGQFYIDDGRLSGSAQTESVLEKGELGQFTFSKDVVAYNFVRNDTLFEGSGQWNLKLDKVQNGFFKSNRWTLTISDEFVFELHFEDSTTNSEKMPPILKWTVGH